MLVSIATSGSTSTGFELTHCDLGALIPCFACYLLALVGRQVLSCTIGFIFLTAHTLCLAIEFRTYMAINLLGRQPRSKDPLLHLMATDRARTVTVLLERSAVHMHRLYSTRSESCCLC